MLHREAARIGAFQLHFDYGSFRPLGRDEPSNFDPALWRGFKLSIIVAFRATECLTERDRWTGRPGAVNIAQTRRLFVGIMGLNDDQYVYVIPKSYERAMKIRAYRVGPEAGRAFRRLIKLCPEVKFTPTA